MRNLTFSLEATTASQSQNICRFSTKVKKLKVRLKMTQTSQTIEVTLSSITETEVNVQQLPFSTDYNGPANMKEYFTVVDSAEDGIKESSFRGRPLQGKETLIPAGYSGIILKESASSSEDQEDRRMMIQHKFNKFTHWGLEHVPRSRQLHTEITGLVGVVSRASFSC
ncbi:RNASEH2C [Bugula neritina]|uniref:RNASEH2C n=1 Tax=Bugula neritina TaxID=10212 RepID=A0A7J7KTR6_BUGNE|nr:RNASEH2C [Bugula neritina]